MTTKVKIIIAVTVTLASYAAGRWSAPEKIKIETKTVTVEKLIKDTDKTTDKDRHKKLVVTEKTDPDGTHTKTTTVTDDTVTQTNVKSKTTDDTASTSDTQKEITRPSSKVTLSLMAGINLGLGGNPLIYGGSVYKPILGPIGLGVFYLTNGSTGASIGLSF